ncbi:MAG: tRNA (adenosine(37)-N6)-dimethylallyltransferase MiaA [Candidatus Altimarinota bacterium]
MLSLSLEHKKHLFSFLSSETTLPKIIVIYGPTASGKSGLSVEIGRLLLEHGYFPEIISADSRQVYRGLDIGTGKILPSEMDGIPHHLLDIIDPNTKYSMIDYRRDFDNLPLWESENIVPILCGGTGLYIDAVLYDMAFPENPPDWKYRNELEAIRQEKGNEFLWNMLFEVDPEYAKELSPSNYRYIIRGLEVMRDTGRSKRESHNTKSLRFSPFFVTPYLDSPENRKFLYEKIDSRVQDMFNNGLIEEVKYNISSFTSHCPGLETIGYKEVVDYLEEKSTLEDAISLVQQHSRNYAKRQITWNKRYGCNLPII